MIIKCLFFVVLMSACFAAPPRDFYIYCRRWRDGDRKCITELSHDEVFKTNVMTMYSNYYSGDKVMSISHYLQTLKADYVSRMFWNRTGSPDVSYQTCSDFPSTTVQGIYPVLEKPLSSSLTRFKGYRITALLDLMVLMYRKRDGHFGKRLSYSMVKQFVGRRASVEKIATFLMQEGVCTEQDYANEVLRGRAINPVCHRYFITGIEKLKDLSVCDLAREVALNPLYAEISVDPSTFMFYSRFSETPLNKFSNYPNLAGVLTGFNVTTAKPFWVMYIKRHGHRNNKVRVGLDRENDSAHLTKSVYRIEVNEETYRNSTNLAGFWTSVCSAQDLANVDPSIERLRIRSDCMNDVNTLVLSHLKQLVAVDIQDRSCRGVGIFRLSGAPSLRSLFIGEDCFNENPRNRINSDGTSSIYLFEVIRNPLLEEIVVGKGSFDDYNIFNIRELPALQRLVIGEATDSEEDRTNSFYWVESLSLTELPALSFVELGNGAFSQVATFELDDLRNLEYLKIGRNALKGKDSSDSTDSVFFTNLPALKLIQAETNCFKFIKVVTLSDMPVVETARFGEYNFALLQRINYSGHVNDGVIVAKAICEKRRPAEIYDNNQDVSTCSSLLAN